MNSDIITPKQFYRLMVILIISTGILDLPSISIRAAGNGGWLSPLLSSLIGLVDIGVIYVLVRLYPHGGLIQFCIAATGNFVGRVIGLTISLFFWNCGSNTFAEIIGFLHAYVLKRTPQLAISIFVLGGIAIILHMGIQGFSRLNELLFLMVYLVVIIGFIGVVGTFRTGAFLPLLDRGWIGVLKGAYVPSSWFGEFLLAGMFLENIVEKKSIVRQLLKAYACSVIVMVAAVVTVIGVFGSEAGATLNFSTFNVFRSIQLGDFFQHLEIVFEGPLIAFVLIKSIMFFYAGVRGMALSLKIPDSDSRSLIPPFMVMTLIVNQWLFPREAELNEFSLQIWPIYSLVIDVALPLCLLLVYIGKVGVGKWIVK